MPKISIVLPTYNGAKFIGESIESVISQTEGDWELIIVDDASSDDTLRICKEFASRDARIRIISNQQNKKLPVSLNIGFAAAAGKYLTWTSDDNIYKPDALRVMSDHLDRTAQTGLVCCENDLIDDNGALLGIRDYRKGRDKSYFLLADNNIGACFMYTRQVYEHVGDYNSELFCAEDYEYWIRVALSFKVDYLRENHYKYREHKSGLSFTKSEVVRNRTIEIRSKYLPLMMSKFEIPERDISYIYYLMWRYDTSNWPLIRSAIRKDPRYLPRAIMHWQKMTSKRIARAVRQPFATVSK